MKSVEDILRDDISSKDDIVRLLVCSDSDELERLKRKAYEVKTQHVGNVVYFRGLVEFSNICAKDCLYCGIRSSNTQVARYNASNEEILEAARYAYENNYASMVLQSGEVNSRFFVDRVDQLLSDIKALSGGKLGITLSCGEQEPETYKRWFESGAHRYLLRIETSNKHLYQQIHPNNSKHVFERRMACLQSLKEIGYQVGTGIMLGLPSQTIGDIADDLLFMRDFDVDMVGMGPYIEHEDTPLFARKNDLLPIKERLTLALKAIAILRIMMKDINIAAATALQAIDPIGREKGLSVGANVIMPNITPTKYREDYQLYKDKPCLDDEADDCKNCLEARIHLVGDKIGYGEWGDSQHYDKRNQV